MKKVVLATLTACAFLSSYAASVCFADSVSSDIDLTLINVDDGNATVKVLGDTNSLPASNSRLTIVADFKAPATKTKVYFHLKKNGAQIYYNPEIGAPWTLFTNSKSDYIGKVFSAGAYQVKVVVTTGTGAAERALMSRTVAFTLTKSASSNATPTPTPKPNKTPTRIPTRTPTPGIHTHYNDGGRSGIRGVVYNPGDLASADVAKNLLYGELGATSTRSWMTIHWSNPPSSGDFKKFRDLKGRGFKTVVVLNVGEHSPHSEVPSVDTATKYFQAVLAAGRDAVDYWEIENEVDLKKYWPGTATEYIQRVLIPAHDVLHNAGEKIICSSTSQSASNLNQLIALGMLSYCDAAAFHPYNILSTQVQRVSEVRKYIDKVKPSMPLFITEWNVYDSDNRQGTTKWQNDLMSAAGQIDGDVDGVWYYRATTSATAPSGGSAPYSSSGTRRNSMFCPVFNALHGFETDICD